MESLLVEELLPSDEEQVRGGQKFNQAATEALLNSGGPALVFEYSFAQLINPRLFFDKEGGEVALVPAEPQIYTIDLAPKLAKRIK